MGWGRARHYGLHANDEDLSRPRSGQKEQTQRGFLRYSSKGQGPTNPFQLARGFEGREGQGQKPAGFCKPAARRGGLAPLLSLAAGVSAGEAVAFSPAREWGRPFPAPPISPPAPLGRRQSPEARTPRLDDGEAGSEASTGQSEFSLRRP